MDTSTLSTFDFTAELWRFVRGRFAFQAKQLKRLTEQPLAQCYEVLAIGHGFSGWRGMSKVLDAMCEIDRLHQITEDAPGLDDYFKKESLPARLGVAVNNHIDEIHDDEESVHWKFFEQVVSRPPTLRGGDHEMEAIEGAISCHPLRASLFFKAAWLGQGAPWSGGLMDEAFNFESSLSELWDGAEGKAICATRAIFGSYPTERTSYWTDSGVMMAEFNNEVDRILAHKRASSKYLGDSVKAYRLADASVLLSVDEWRKRMKEIHSDVIDSCWDSSFTASLILANAPQDALITFELIKDDASQRYNVPIHQFVPQIRAFAPSPEKAAQLGTCMADVPMIEPMTPSDIEEAGLPRGQGEWHLVHSI